MAIQFGWQDLPMPQPSAPNALFVSSNGTGMGHLTRLLAYARRCEPEFQPHFFSLSQAAQLAATFDYRYEYLPSATASGLKPRRWHEYFATTLLKAVDRLRPEVVVFDGAWPYEGLRLAIDDAPGLRWIWSRRGMWQEGQNRDQLRKSSWFDLVLEPGDLASTFDRGVTGSAEALRVPPVTLLDADELADRATARAALGLNPDKPHALVTLGAGAINDISQDLAASIRSLRKLDVEICVTSPEIAASDIAHDDVHVVREFPLSRHFHAFDVAISACGYNSFHELLRFGIPTLFVPNRSTALDDQAARGQFAARSGIAYSVDEVAEEQAVLLLGELLERGHEIVAKTRALDPGNGAAEAAAAIMSA